MKKLLYIGDYSNSGFGTVAKGLLRGLAKTGEYEIFQIGINYRDIVEFDEPWKIVPAGWSSIKDNMLITEDAYGYTRIDFFLERFDPDIVFVNNDYAIAQRYMRYKGKPTKLSEHRSIKVLYSPVDAEPVPKAFVEVAKMFDLNIAYTDWQRQLMAEHDPMFAFMPVLYHGFNPEVFYPIEKNIAKQKLVDIMVDKNENIDRIEFEKRILDRFLVYFVGTNQFRKDLPCLFRAFEKFHEQVPNSTLIPHTDTFPRGYNGWNLQNLQMLTGVTDAILMNQADVFEEWEMNVFYNAADVLAYPTRGEGFGLPSLEAMAVKTPVIVPAFGASQELHRDGRGYFMEIVDVIPKDIDASGYLVLPDHRSLAKWLKFVHDNPEDVKEKTETAFEWAQGLTWETQSQSLHSILQKLPEGRNASDIQENQENKPSG